MNKAGWQTSEFWMALIVSNVMLVVNAVGVAIPESVVVSIAGMVMAYAVSRGWVKSKAE